MRRWLNQPGRTMDWLEGNTQSAQRFCLCTCPEGEFGPCSKLLSDSVSTLKSVLKRARAISS